MSKRVSVERLRQVLRYDEATGNLIWKLRGIPGWDAHYGGTVAGSTNDEGYRVLSVDRISLKAHRVIWALHHGRWPSGRLDHKDGVRARNSIDAIRPATPRQNAANARVSRANHLGRKGVYEVRPGRFRAQIMVNGRKTNLGNYDTPAAAQAAYFTAARAAFGEFARV